MGAILYKQNKKKGGPSLGPATWLARHAKERPAQIALVATDGTIFSYERLNRVVADRARALLKLGLHSGDLILIVTRDTLEQRLLRLAAHCVGAIEGVIDPRLSEFEICDRIATTKPRLIIADRVFNEAGQCVVDIDTLKDQVNGFTSKDMLYPVDNSGRVLFTTGSSGRSQAVLHKERHLESAAISNAKTRGLRKTDIYLALLPAFHAAGSLFEDSILFLGGGIVLPPRGSSEWVRTAFDFYPATITSVLPSMLRPLLKNNNSIHSLNKLRLINYAGEIIAQNLLVELCAAYKGELTRGYGLTEAGPLVSVLPNTCHRSSLPEPSDLGLPAYGVQIRVAADNPNEGGELLVRSGHLMVGYLNDEEATKQKIVDGWLYTGDQVRLEGQHIHLLGRLSGRIRSGGEWLHPTEIEATIASVPGVEDVVVVARADSVWGERPVAFIQVAEDFSSDRLHSQMRRRLARFKWPDWIEILDGLPRLGPGKVNRLLLRQRTESGPPANAIRLRSVAEQNKPSQPK